MKSFVITDKGLDHLEKVQSGESDFSILDLMYLMGIKNELFEYACDSDFIYKDGIK